MEFTFEISPWEQAISALQPGEKIDALDCLPLLEELSETEAEEALLALEERGIGLDISRLPEDTGSGETALRLRLEKQLANNPATLQSLEETDPLRVYLTELAQTPVSGDADLLARQFADGDDTAAEKLASLHLSLVVERAYAHTGYGVLLLDLIQEGSLGLWQGILCYTQGDFTAHAKWWIDQYLAKAAFLQARSGGIGEKLRRGMADYRDMDQQLLAELGRNPTLDEIAEAIHTTPQQAAVYGNLLMQAKAKQQVEKAMEQPEQTPDDEQAVENTAYFQIRQRIAEMLSTLEKREADVLTLRFGLDGKPPRTPQQAGQALGLTEAEIMELETAALAKLRQQGN